MPHAEQSETARLREVALSQAAHDLKGNARPEEVVKRAEVYLGFLGGGKLSPHADLTDAQVKHMVDRFLGWKLPQGFNPDNGITFSPSDHQTAGEVRSPHWPSGTNLFDLRQAVGMIRYMAKGLPAN